MLSDFRYALRQLWRTPGFTAAAIVTLALGIGANTALFAVVNALQLRPNQGAHVEDVWIVHYASRVDSRLRTGEMPIAAFRQLEAAPPDGVTQIAAIDEGWPVTVQIPGRAQTLQPELVSGGYASLLNLKPAAGRWITSEDERTGAPVAVISDVLWREWFGRRADAIGQPIRVENRIMTIVGVAERGFGGVKVRIGRRGPGDGTHLWLPISPTANPAVRPATERLLGTAAATIIVRSPSDISAAALTSAIKRPAATAVGEDPASVWIGADELPAVSSSEWSTTLSILALSTLILVAACANLANMLYARGAQRTAEVAVRMSLGASRGRVFRLFLAETVLIASAASVFGLAVAQGVIAAFLTAFPVFGAERMRFALDLELDAAVFAYAFGAGCVAAILVGLSTAWRSSRVAPARMLGASGAATGVTGRGTRRRLVLVAVQVTAAFLLVMTAGIFLTSRDKGGDRDLAYDATQLASGRLDVRLAGYNDTRGRAFFARVLAELRQRPDVEGAALTTGLPQRAGGTVITGGADRAHVGATPRLQGSFAGVDHRFFETFRLPIVRGRALAPSDADGAPRVAVVTESVAAVLWSGLDPIGQQVKLGSEFHWMTVVGVSVDPVAQPTDTARVSGGAWVFVPFEQRYSPIAHVVVRGERPAALIEPLRDLVRRLDESVPVLDAAPVDEAIGLNANARLAARWLMGSLGAVALLIAVVGIYGVVSYVVSTRTREFGIRLALGATPVRVLFQVLDQALTMLLVGLLPGVLLAALGTNVAVFRLLKGAMPNPLLTWIVVPPMVLAIGLFAGFIPARRAARTDPNVALREL